MIESPIEEWVCDKAEAAGWLAYKCKWIGRRNAPDRFFAKDGRIVLIEFKNPDGKARATQEKEIARLREHGVEVHLANNALTALRILGVSYVPE